MSRVVVNEIQAKVGNDVTFNDTVKIDTIKGKTTAGSVTVQGEGTNTTNLQQGLAKTWCHLDLNTENTIDDSLNVSSISDEATGKVAVTSTNVMASINYTSLGNAWNGSADNYDRVVTPYAARITNIVYQAIALTSNHSLNDCQDVDIVNHGDLA